MTRTSSGLSWTGCAHGWTAHPRRRTPIARKRAAFHGALGYAVEFGLLPANPIGLVGWRAPKPVVAVSRATVASPAQVRAILAGVSRIRPELAAFFGCLYYAALRPEEAVALRRDDLILPAQGRGKMVLTAACPRTGAAWTSTGTRVLHDVYVHCISGQDDTVSQRIEDGPRPRRQRATVITVRESKRLYAPSAPPQTLSAICT